MQNMDKQLLAHVPRAGLVPGRACSVARVLDVVGDGWSFLLLRAAFFGEVRFEGFVSRLGAPRSQVTGHLGSLVQAGLFRREAKEYRLTECGLALYSVCVGFMLWGDVYANPEGRPPPIILEWCDELAGEAGQDLRGQAKLTWVCAACGKPFSSHDCTWRHGPGAGVSPEKSGGRRRSADKALFARAEPCSVARALRVVGDHWTFLPLRELYFGAHRFDELVANLGIARNVLSNRLADLVMHGVVVQLPLNEGAKWHSYHLSPSGLALYPVIAAMIAWGDRWLVTPEGPPLVLTHSVCGNRLRPLLGQQGPGGVWVEAKAHRLRPVPVTFVGRASPTFP